MYQPTRLAESVIRRPNAAFSAWRLESDAADQERGIVIPVTELPGMIEGRICLERAAWLCGDPAAPGALLEIRRHMRTGLKIIPQGRPALWCHDERWLKVSRSRREDWLRDVCESPTCGRCVPLRIAQAGPHA
ncbi:hypothetical protein [Streptomyces sp. H39-C1]|uniref:hypothetical protein n=1 Tax=Streptomyces sp. H39-C1 TaxID=3004355 RepID=UPI0022AEBB93|nr:hypothetical protein [Streptomyces sp. H39-C1]MCZ4101092.1 hypothetical protein [Streptomyces sp. H39-C1]